MSDVFDLMASMDHEQVLFCHEPELGLRAIIAIHDTRLGPSLGGVRVLPYATEREALVDVLRLARGMTYKNALAGLDNGGGKSVLIVDPAKKDEGLLRAFGRHVHSLGGRYLVAEDMNASPQDMDWIHAETPYVTGRSEATGGIGPPGPCTAAGVFVGIAQTLKHVTGSDDLSGRIVAVQGLGSVGEHLGARLHAAGASLVVTDLDPGRVQRAVDAWGARAVAPDEILAVDCDVLAPCARGAVVSEATVVTLRCTAICGGANNILADEEADAERLDMAGIAFAPDYVVNSGGVIAMDAEWHGRDLASAVAATEARVADITAQVFSRAAADRCTTIRASRALAEERMASVHRARALLAPRWPRPDGRHDPR